MLTGIAADGEIEMFFDILKNGCKVEALQLSTIERLELALTGRTLLVL